MNRVVELIVNAVMVNVPVTDVQRASPATAVVIVPVVKKYAAALNKTPLKQTFLVVVKSYSQQYIFSMSNY